MGDVMPPVHRFLQTLEDEDYKALEELAKQRKMTVQKFVRYHVFPEWMETNKPKNKHRKLARKELAEMRKPD